MESDSDFSILLAHKSIKHKNGCADDKEVDKWFAEQFHFCNLRVLGSINGIHPSTLNRER
jgi:hypothetical protein